MKRIWVVIIGIVIIVGGGFFVISRQAKAQTAAQSNLQTASVTRGDLTATVGATGTVRAGQSALVNWETSGRIDKVNVSVGQAVKAGEVLAGLARSSLSQNLILAESDLVEARRAMENLKDSAVQQAQAQQALVAAQKAYDDAKKARDRLDGPRASTETIQSAEANYYLAQAKVDDAEGAFNRVSGALETDVARANALANLANAKKERDKALVNLNWYKGHAGDQEYTEKDADLALAEAQLEDARREWERLKNGPDPDDIQSAEARIAAIKATLKQSKVSAPFNGSVTVVEVKPGDLVSPGSPAFRLDDLSHLYVDVQVSEVDINRVQAGQAASLVFDAIQGKEYHGQVTDVAMVGEDNQGAVNFTVTLELTDADESVKPGMTAGVNIVVKRDSGVLLVPNRAVSTVDGKRVVWVLRNGVRQQVEIQLGATSEQSSEVVSGDLKEGDTLMIGSGQTLPGPGGMMFGARSQP